TRRQQRGSLPPDLEKQLVCPVCLELFSKPVVILPCQHNLCRNSPGPDSNRPYGYGGRFRCPSCRHEVVLDRHGVYGLQRNLLVENIIDIYRQQNRLGSGPGLLPSPLICPEHPEERINIYCCLCETPTCSLCKVFGPHKDCEVAPLADVYQQKKSELSDGIAGLVAINDHIQALISQMEDICRTVELVSQSVEGLVHILEQRKQELISAITEEQDERQRHVRALIRVHGQYLGVGVALVERAVVWSLVGSLVWSLFWSLVWSLFWSLVWSLSSRGAELPRLELGFENMGRFSVDIENLSHKLQNIHFCHGTAHRNGI
uniref:Tripartite motif-containing protein 54 n=1 Tax=Periophthalmus magnuspinnatus TaxID=409849 RepID=A0A3B3ZJP9_9GOBI